VQRSDISSRTFHRQEKKYCCIRFDIDLSLFDVYGYVGWLLVMYSLKIHIWMQRAFKPDDRLRPSLKAPDLHIWLLFAG